MAEPDKFEFWVAVSEFQVPAAGLGVCDVSGYLLPHLSPYFSSLFPSFSLGGLSADPPLSWPALYEKDLGPPGSYPGLCQSIPA
jgi:hypothetical protein